MSLTSLPTSEMTRLYLEIDEQSGLMLSRLWDGQEYFFPVEAAPSFVRCSQPEGRKGLDSC